MGPFRAQSLDGFQSALRFVCDYRKACVKKFIKKKSKVLDKFKDNVADTKKLWILRRDNGNEFVS